MPEIISMSPEEIRSFAKIALVGRFATITATGYPYTIAVHFVYEGNVIFIHGRNKGRKIENLRGNSKVGFEIDTLHRVITEDLEVPCDAYVHYHSVVAMGQARLVDDVEEKRRVLTMFMAKYLPDDVTRDMPEGHLDVTAVIRIDIEEISGKILQN